MVYESSYESGRKPFLPDTTRGHWEQPSDFIFTCMGLAFKMDFFVAPMMFLVQMGIFAIIPYMICIALYVVPIMVIQSFMGQFSSSGFISAFRLSPIFKGMGYISLALNFMVLTYYTTFATVPMVYLLNSFRPTLPWSCDVFEMAETGWNATQEERLTICNVTDEVFDRIKEVENDTRIMYDIPSVIYFKDHFLNMDYEGSVWNFSWGLFACTLLTWAIIAGVFYKFFCTPQLGKILRYAIWGTLGVLGLCIMRFLFLPGVWGRLHNFVMPESDDVLYGIPSIFIYTIMAFGPGWGSVISLASFNKFNTNIMRDSWIICTGQMLIFMAFNFIGGLVDWHYSHITNDNYYGSIYSHWNIYLSSGSAISNMKFANFWSLLFYGMLTSAALIVMITQLYSLLVSIFDEFEFLRPYKLKVTLIMIGVLAFCSIYLCTNDGLINFSALSIDSLVTQTSLNLLLLLVVLWIYGRERFQRDIGFMLGQPFATWKINLLRYFVPLCLLFVLLISVVDSIFLHMYSSFMIGIVSFLFIVLPWLSIPAYGAFISLQTIGPWQSRVKRSCRPTDWYPVEADDRQRYEEAVGNENVTHQLSSLGEEVL